VIPQRLFPELFADPPEPVVADDFADPSALVSATCRVDTCHIPPITTTQTMANVAMSIHPF